MNGSTSLFVSKTFGNVSMKKMRSWGETCSEGTKDTPRMSKSTEKSWICFSASCVCVMATKRTSKRLTIQLLICYQKTSMRILISLKIRSNPCLNSSMQNWTVNTNLKWRRSTLTSATKSLKSREIRPLLCNRKRNIGESWSQSQTSLNVSTTRTELSARKTGNSRVSTRRNATIANCLLRIWFFKRRRTRKWMTRLAIWSAS